MIRNTLAAALAAAMLAAPTSAGAVFIDFAGLTAPGTGINLGDSYATNGVTFSVETPGANTSVRVFNNIPDSASYILSCDFTPGGNPCDENMLIDFGGDIQNLTFDAFADDAAGLGGKVTAFLDGAIVGTVDIFTDGLAGGDLVSLVALGVIDALKIESFDVAGLGFSNFLFDIAGGPNGEIPLPAALPLFLMGLGGIGAMRKRRKSA